MKTFIEVIGMLFFNILMWGSLLVIDIINRGVFN